MLTDVLRTGDPMHEVHVAEVVDGEVFWDYVG